MLLIALAQVSSGNAAGQTSAVATFAGNAQHTAIYQAPAQNLNTIHWSTAIDLNNSGAFAHYGAPLITVANTVLVPVKTATDGFQVSAFEGSSGAPKYTLDTDYVLPSHHWIPTYNPALATGLSGTRLYYPGHGGTIYYIDNPDSAAHDPPVQEVFYTSLSDYLANAAAFNSSVFINTPITADSNGNVFFGFRVQGTAPAPLSTTQSGFARIDATGNGTYVLAGTAAGDSGIGRDSHNSAPALSNDESTLYVVVKSSSTDYYGYLLGLDSTTLNTRYKVLLKDPRNGGTNNAGILDDSTASPTVAPDNDVYFGVFGNPDNGSRGFLLRFSSDLAVEKTPGAFGWDYTPAIVPATMLASYQGASSYLIFSKYNNYAGLSGGNGVNKIALLDPNATQLDPRNGLKEMREVLAVIGVTPDEENYSTSFPYAVREWCINTAAVNPVTNSIFVPSEDGHIYCWNLITNSLSQVVALTPGVGEPYVPTVIGPDGTVYTLNGGSLFALGSLNQVYLTLASSVPDVRTVVAGQSLTFTANVENPGSSGLIPSGSVTFQDFTYQGLTPVTTTLASNVPLDSSGEAEVTTSSLSVGDQFLGNHFITATYSGDGNFSGGSATLVQKIHASASTTTVSSSPNPSSLGQAVSFTVTVASAPPGTKIPSGMVTFQDGLTVLAQIPLSSSGTASFKTSPLSTGSHTISAAYNSDTVFASSSGNTTQAVGPAPTPTPIPTIQATVQTNLAGLAFTVDGTTYSATQTFSWASGSSHTIATSSPQSGDTGVRYTWSKWSDGGAISHSITPTKNTTYTANFTTQYYLTMNAGSGGKVSPASGWKNSGAAVSVTATPTNNAQVSYRFSNWTGSGPGSYSGTNNPASITMNGPITESATFTQNPVQITVQANPTGLSFVVDGTTYTSTQAFSWTPGSSHTLATTSPQNGGTGVRYVWNSWSDSGAISHTVAPTKNTAYTAKFSTQYYLTMNTGSGGKVTPTSGWRNSGATTSISATAATGYTFSNWSGSGTGSYSGTNNPSSITMGGPITETAIFTQN